jgi:hypothetical protein
MTLDACATIRPTVQPFCSASEVWQENKKIFKVVLVCRSRWGGKLDQFLYSFYVDSLFFKIVSVYTRRSSTGERTLVI